MSFFLTFSNVSFTYEALPEILFDKLNLQLPSSWTGISGANGAGKSTLLKLAAGLLVPDEGVIRGGDDCRFCEQEVELAPGNLSAFFSSCDAYAFALRDKLNLRSEMAARWDTLSMGERKKLQIGCALFEHPRVLCLDEPTNHLDMASRRVLASELRRFAGVGIVISHDRELLDELCSQCVFIENGEVLLLPGGISAGREQIRQKLNTMLHERSLARDELKHSKRELQRRREKEQKSRNLNSKRKLDRHDHDGKGKIDAARLTGRDGKAGAAAAKQAKIVGVISEKLENFGRIKIPKYELEIPLGTVSKRNLLLDFASRVVKLGENRILRVPDLMIGPRDRVSLGGVNGGGKSTLITHLMEELKLPSQEYLYMPQELDEAMRDSIYQAIRSLEKDEFRRVMKVVAGLGSRPERVLDSKSCSPGEWRKLFLGLGVLREVGLFILDEPTNHFDLPSIECLESALSSCETALLLVSHDRHFVKKLCNIHWQIAEESPGVNLLLK